MADGYGDRHTASSRSGRQATIDVFACLSQGGGGQEIELVLGDYDGLRIAHVGMSSQFGTGEGYKSARPPVPWNLWRDSA